MSILYSSLYLSEVSLGRKLTAMTSLKNAGNCRGDGKLYLLYVVRGEKPVRVIARSISGHELPSRLVVLDDSKVVVVLADFAITQTISFVDGAGNVISSNRISAKAIALQSKANGVLRKDLCAQIRNIDRSGLHARSSVSLDRIVPCSDGVILRGIVANSDSFTFDKVVAFDEHGAKLGESCPLFDGVASARMAATPFSVHVPALGKGLCLAAIDDSGHQSGVFVNYKRDEVDRFEEESRALYLDASGDQRYQLWLSRNRLTELGAAAQRAEEIDGGPSFSIIVPLYKTTLDFFVDMADSVLSQTYPNWELVLVNSTPEDEGLHDLVLDYASKDARIRYIDLEGNLGITGNTNKGIEIAKGDYLCFFDHDDVLEPDILFEYAKAIVQNPSINLLYCDEDKLLPDGTLANPTFKPDFSLDMVRDNNYICHLLTVKRVLLAEIEASGKELDGAQDHAMVLKIAELGGPIHHVPKILYHWRISETSTAGNSDSKPYATIAGVKAVQQHLDRVGLPAKVSNSHGRAFRYTPDYEVPASASCSVVVATRADRSALERFLAGIQNTGFDNLELVFVCPEGRGAVVDEVMGSSSLSSRWVEMGSDFNIAAWNNAGAAAACGDVLLFAHDDIRPASPAWVHVLAGFALRSDVGPVGTMTCDSDGVVQQAGYTFVRDSVVPLSRGRHCTDPGYIFYPLTVRDVAAVSGACLAISRDHFAALGGFNEAYQLDYSDIDLCFKAARSGLKVIYTPEARVYHAAGNEASLCHESRSHKHYEDKGLLLRTWSEEWSRGDRWFSPHFSSDPQEAELYKLGGFEQTLY